MEKDWLCRKFFGIFDTILNILVDIIGVSSFQLVSILEKLYCKFKSFSIEDLKIP